MCCGDIKLGVIKRVETIADIITVKPEDTLFGRKPYSNYELHVFLLRSMSVINDTLKRNPKLLVTDGNYKLTSDSLPLWYSDATFFVSYQFKDPGTGLWTIPLLFVLNEKLAVQLSAFLDGVQYLPLVDYYVEIARKVFAN